MHFTRLPGPCVFHWAEGTGSRDKLGLLGILLGIWERRLCSFVPLSLIKTLLDLPPVRLPGASRPGLGVCPCQACIAHLQQEPCAVALRRTPAQCLIPLACLQQEACAADPARTPALTASL